MSCAPGSVEWSEQANRNCSSAAGGNVGAQLAARRRQRGCALALPAAQTCAVPPSAPAQATLPLPQYGQRLLALYGGVLLLLGGPIAAQTFEPLEQVGWSADGAAGMAAPALGGGCMLFWFAAVACAICFPCTCTGVGMSP